MKNVRSAALTLYHPDGVSGIMILDDQTRVYWGEGRSSDVKILYSDGHWETIDAGPEHIGHWYWALEPEGEGRDMTPAEVREYEAARVTEER